MEKLPNADLYTTFSYHLNLLEDFQHANTTTSNKTSHKRSTSSVPASVHGDESNLASARRRSSQIMTGGSVRGGGGSVTAGRAAMGASMSGGSMNGSFRVLKNASWHGASRTRLARADSVAST